MVLKMGSHYQQDFLGGRTISRPPRKNLRIKFYLHHKKRRVKNVSDIMSMTMSISSLCFRSRGGKNQKNVDDICHMNAHENYDDIVCDIATLCSVVE